MAPHCLLIPCVGESEEEQVDCGVNTYYRVQPESLLCLEYFPDFWEDTSSLMAPHKTLLSGGLWLVTCISTAGSFVCKCYLGCLVPCCPCGSKSLLQRWWPLNICLAWSGRLSWLRFHCNMSSELLHSYWYKKKASIFCGWCSWVAELSWTF